MTTPVADFVQQYSSSGMVRMHMPGHKGRDFLGIEPLDITEVKGADALYEADGIIAESEANAAALFGSGKTVFSTEGSSQCIRAMLFLASTYKRQCGRVKILAARNAHKAFLYACALIDADICWIRDGASSSICSCHVYPEMIEQMLSGMDTAPACVYITSPDYLGAVADIQTIAEICHAHGTLLCVDNAHGAYLHFLDKPVHPLDLGCDMCCDSAHKTLPVLTGGAYLHISSAAPEELKKAAKRAMALFGSTSPSYLIMNSLDLCNKYIENGYRERLSAMSAEIKRVKDQLLEYGWEVLPSDAMRITISCDGEKTAASLRKIGIECEFADRDYIVFMLTPENTAEELRMLAEALGKADKAEDCAAQPCLSECETVLSPRDAIFSPQETVHILQSAGRVCASPNVACPPAIPIVVSGERIDENAIKLFEYYGIEYVDVVKEETAG